MTKLLCAHRSPVVSFRIAPFADIGSRSSIAYLDAAYPQREFCHRTFLLFVRLILTTFNLQVR
ncbi:hypothetical protein CPY51_10175 [Rhizobium tubonense]|uniref:Uncharacterized protein n=1 Tax=Rhizobium tubonense TaxID=484088 RepID=A0A2W4CPI1_9HYPH|nr:hypothetical protein CPY51_10175 [Rhizobium tubonense]